MNLRIPCLAITLLIGPLGMKPSGQAALREVIVSHTDEKDSSALSNEGEWYGKSPAHFFQTRMPHAKLLARRKKLAYVEQITMFGHPYFDPDGRNVRTLVKEGMNLIPLGSLTRTNWSG